MTIETLIADPIKASPPPQNLTATAGGASVVLTWEPPSSAGSSPIDGYEIYFGTNSTPSTLFTTVGNTTLTVDVTGLIPGTLYYFGVKAFNATGDGPMSNVVSATPYSSPGDFDYQLINSGTAVQITGYYGSGGAVAIPGMIDGRPVTSIGDWAFYDCPMTSVTIPGSVTSMGDSAFRECSAMTSLNIGSGVISIGPYAFYEDSALASVTVPSSVTSIGEGAFASCTAMTSVTIGSGVTSIGPYAFYACTHLTSVTIPSSVTTIGAHAFQSCTAMTSVIIGSGVASMGDSAFRECSSLSSLTISDGVTSIGPYAFYSDTSLASVTIPNSVTIIWDGAFASCTAMTSVTIGSGVASIGNGAFYYCTALTQMYFEGSAPTCGLTWISNHNANLIIYYYDGNTGFPSTWYGVPTVCLFVDPPNWTKYTGNPILTNGALAAYGSVLKVGGTYYMYYTYHQNAAYDSIGLATSTDGKHWTIDAGANPVLTYGAAGAWDHGDVWCPMVWKEGSAWYMIYTGDDSDAGLNLGIGLATSTDGLSWTKSESNPVLSGTFAWEMSGGYSKLENYGIMKVNSTYYLWYNTLGTPIRQIGLATSTDLRNWSKDVKNPIFSTANYSLGCFSAFPFKYGSYYYLLVPHYTSGTDYTLIELWRDSSPTFYPADRTDVGVAIDIGTGTSWDSHDQDTACVLTDDIYRDSFSAGDNELWCYYAGEHGGTWQTGLTIETLIDYPPGDPPGDFDYQFINSGTQVQITGYHGSGGAVVIPGMIDGRPVISIGDWAFAYSPITSVNIPSSVTSIGDSAFRSCSLLAPIIIGSGVTSIGVYAFCFCSNLNSVTIPGSVTTLGEGAFYDCTAMTSVTIGSGVTSIGNGAFYACTHLTSVTIPGSVTSIGAGAFYYCTAMTSVIIGSDVTSMGDSAFRGCTALTSLTISNGVTSIGPYAFCSDTSLASVTIPGSVTTLGEGAFYDCTAMTSVTIGSGVTSIGNGAFYACTHLTSVTIPGSVTSIGAGAFYYCTAMTSVTIPGSVTSIGDLAFYHCISLTSVTIPGSVTYFGDSAFRECSSLTSLTISDGVTSIGVYAFCFCSNLNSVTIPGSVTTLGEGAFYDCTAMTSVTIGSGVTSIGNGAFYACTHLTSVTIPGSVTIIGNGAFYYCTAMTEMHFEGNAPTCGSYWIAGHNADLVIYYFNGNTGFPTPTWDGVPTVGL